MEALQRITVIGASHNGIFKKFLSGKKRRLQRITAGSAVFPKCSASQKIWVWFFVNGGAATYNGKRCTA
jgi:hypothetical protein